MQEDAEQGCAGWVELDFRVARIPSRIPTEDAPKPMARFGHSVGEGIPEAHKLTGMVAPRKEAVAQVIAGDGPCHNQQHCHYDEINHEINHRP